MPSVITWCSLTFTTQWPSTTMCHVWQETSGGPHDGSQAHQCHQGKVLAPAHSIPSRLPHQHSPQLGVQHWVVAFLEDSKWVSTLIPMAPTIGVYIPMLAGGYRDICYSMKMLQCPFSRCCRLYAIYFRAMLSQDMPLGAVTSVF